MLAQERQQGVAVGQALGGAGGAWGARGAGAFQSRSSLAATGKVMPPA